MEAFLAHLTVSDPQKVATVLAGCGIDAPDVLVALDEGERDDMIAELKKAEVAIGDRSKMRRVQEADIAAWHVGQTDGSRAAPVAQVMPAAAAPLSSAAGTKTEKFVLKATQELLTRDELWDRGISKDDVEPLTTAAERTRGELRELVSAAASRRADLAAAVALADRTVKVLRGNHDSTASAIEAQLSAVQSTVEKRLDELRASVAESVHSRKQALLAEAASSLAERVAKFEAQRSDLSTAEAQHAAAEAAGTDALGKADDAVLGLQAHVAALCTAYGGSLEPATHTGIAFDLKGADAGELVAVAAGQITDAVIGFLAPLSVVTELPAVPTYAKLPEIVFLPGVPITPVKPCTPFEGECLLTAAGFPTGLHLDPRTGIISGSLQSEDSGTHQLSMIAENAVGKNQAVLKLSAAVMMKLKTVNLPDKTGSGRGSFFDVVNTSGRSLAIAELGLVAWRPAPQTQRVYTRTTDERCGGAEKKQAMWRELGSATFCGTGQLVFPKPEIIAAGCARGFHVHCVGAEVALNNKGTTTDGTLLVEPVGHTAGSYAVWQGDIVTGHGPCGKVCYKQ